MSANKVVQTIIKEFYFNAYTFILIFTPLLFVSSTGELFEFPKTFFIYFAAIVVGFFYVADITINPSPLRKPSVPVLFYLLVFIVTTLTSSHLYTSLWGYYTRFNDGLLSVLAFFVLYFVAKNKLNAYDISKLSNVILLPLIPISLFGISQHFGFLDGQIMFGNKVERVYSTLGQPNWLAQYIVMLLPLVLFKIFDNVKVTFWSFVYVISFMCLFFTYSLSGFAGYSIAFGLSVVYLLRTARTKAVIWKIAVIIIFMLITPLLFPGILKERVHDLKQDIFGNTVTIVNAQEGLVNPQAELYQLSDAGFIRKNTWAGTWNLITSSSKTFFLGTGPETYPYTFQPFRPRELNYSSEWAYLFNKPHNYYLEIWSESGLIGLFAYVTLFAYLFYRQSAVKKIALCGFAVTNIFGWPVVATTLVFWYWLIEIEVARDA